MRPNQNEVGAIARLGESQLLFNLRANTGIRTSATKHVNLAEGCVGGHEIGSGLKAESPQLPLFQIQSCDLFHDMLYGWRVTVVGVESATLPIVELRPFPQCIEAIQERYPLWLLKSRETAIGQGAHYL